MTASPPAIYNTGVPETDNKPPSPAPSSVRGGLTPRQERFAQLVAAGNTLTAAYKIAYKKRGLLPDSANRGAVRIMQTGSVAARVRQLQSSGDKKTLLTVNERYGILTEIAADEAAPKADRIRAIAEYNRMAGDLAPEKIESTIKGDPNAPLAVQVVPLTRAEKVGKLKADYVAAQEARKAERSKGPKP